MGGWGCRQSRIGRKERFTGREKCRGFHVASKVGCSIQGARSFCESSFFIVRDDMGGCGCRQSRTGRKERFTGREKCRGLHDFHGLFGGRVLHHSGNCIDPFSCLQKKFLSPSFHISCHNAVYDSLWASKNAQRRKLVPKRHPATPIADGPRSGSRWHRTVSFFVSVPKIVQQDQCTIALSLAHLLAAARRWSEFHSREQMGRLERRSSTARRQVEDPAHSISISVDGSSRCADAERRRGLHHPQRRSLSLTQYKDAAFAYAITSSLHIH